MTAIKTASTTELNIVPSATSSKNDFDFFHGKWKFITANLSRG